MKIILLLFLCLSFAHCGQSQKQRNSQPSQKSAMSNSPIIKLSEEIEINLYNNNKYSLEGDIWMPNSYMLTRVLISQGEFTIIEDTLILNDKFNDYVQIFLLRNNCAMGIKTFKPFMNEFLSIRHFNEDLDVTWINIQERRKENELSKTGMEKVQYGSYGGTMMNFLLKETNRYVFSIFYNVISEGTFKQNNNELILTDDTTGYVFYFFLTEDSIIENITSISEIFPFN